MAVKMPNLVAYGEKLDQKSGDVPRSGSSVPMPDLVAYGQRTQSASTPAGAAGGVGKSTVRSGAKKTAPASPDLGERVARTASGAVKSMGAAYTNAGGLAVEGAGKVNTWVSDRQEAPNLRRAQEAVSRYENMLRDGKWADGRALTAADYQQVRGMLEQNRRVLAAHQGYTAEIERADKAVADKAYAKADELAAGSARDITRAKEGLGALGGFAVDLGVQGAQMAGDIAASAMVPGAGLALMGLRSGGSAAQEARQAGATYGQQLAYGVGSGALSMATEKIANVAAPFKAAFGGALANAGAEKLLARFGENQTVRIMSQLAKTAGGKLILSAISEGGEEVVEDLVQPILQRATYDPDAKFDAGGAAYDFLMGAAMGGIGAGVEQAGNRVRRLANAGNGPQNVAGATVEAEADTTAGPAQSGAEDMKNAASGAETAGKLTGPENMLRYRGDIDKIFSGKYPSGKMLSVGETPEILVRFGANPLPMTMTQDAAYKIAYPSGYMGGKHNLGMSVLKQLPYQIENPVAILKSNTQPNSVVLLTSWKDGDKSIIVPLHLDRQGAISVDNRIASAYQTGHIQSYLGEADENVLYTKNNEDIHQLLSNGVQFPKAMADDILAKNSIPRGEAKSNSDILSKILFGKNRADMDALTAEQQNAVYRANEAGTVGMDAAGKVFRIDPEQHIDQRGAKDISSRSVNAFQFDHPELHQYYKSAAESLLSELNGAVRGGETQSATGEYGQTYSWRSKRSVSPRIGSLLDSGMSYAEIESALDAIIHDMGQENYANAKRVELALDDMLTNGYSDGLQFHPADEGYLSAKDAIAGSRAQERGHGLDELDAYDTPGDARAGAVNTPFDNMQMQSDTFHPVNPNSAQRVMKDQHRAPSEVPTVNPETGKNITKTVSTILNSPLTSPGMAAVYEDAIAGGKFDYDVSTDRGAVKQAQARIARDGWRTAANDFTAKAELGQRITKADMAEAVSAYNCAVSEGDHKAAFELAAAISEAAHDSAQVTQAMNLMNRMTPEGKLLTLRRLVDRMNDRQARRQSGAGRAAAQQGDADLTQLNYVERETGFRISDELAESYLMAETDAERAAAWDAITTDIAGQIPSTFREKADFWRYTAMLTNPTTHIRNLLGNAIQAGARKIKNGVGAVIERAAVKDQSQRTKSFLLGKEDKALKDFAAGQYETDRSAAMGAGKYSDATTAGIEREIQEKRKAFSGRMSGELAERAAAAVPQPVRRVGDVIGAGVQWLGDQNTKLLDREDVWFNRPAYVDSFAQALKAKGVSAAEAAAGTRAADVEAARAYAIAEAQKATYRNTTQLSDALSKMGRYQGSNQVLRAASFAADAFSPFRRTPANILTTGLDYSPVGLLKGIKEATLDVKSGKCTAADAVDSIASGLTGTGILALGAYLAAEGLLHVRAGDDDREEAFEKASGGQDYALQIGDKSYTLDWAVPAAMPLFAGAAIMEAAQEGGSTFGAVADSLLGTSEVVLETSMLSSLNDLISNWSYADSKPLYLADRAAASYASQYLPTVGGKVASALDDTVRRSYVERGSGQIASDAGYFLQGAAKKVPGLRNQLQPSVGLWGEEVSNGTAMERLVQSFISPGYLKTQDTSAVAQEVRRLAEATGDSRVYPEAAEKSFALNNGETKNLTAEEYTQYAKTLGQTRKQVLDRLLENPAYQRLSDKDKAEAVSLVYAYASVRGKQSVSDYRLPESSWVRGAMGSILPTDLYILYRINADRDHNGSVSSVESAQTLNELGGLTDSQKGQAWAERNSTTKPEKNPFTGALAHAGASAETSINVLNRYRELNADESMKPKEKAAAFQQYVRGLGLTPEQMKAVKSTYTFFGSYPVKW